MIPMLMLMLLAIPAFGEPPHDESERLEYLGPLSDEESVEVNAIGGYERNKIYQMWSESPNVVGGISPIALQYNASDPLASCTYLYVHLAIRKASTYTIKIKALQGGTLAEDGWPGWEPLAVRTWKEVSLTPGYWEFSMHWHPANPGRTKYVATIVKPGTGVISKMSTLLDVLPY